MPKSSGMKGNPLVGVFQTSDGGYINLTILTPGPYLEDTFNHLDMTELMADARLNTTEAIMANWVEGRVLVIKAIAAHPVANWKERHKKWRAQRATYRHIREDNPEEKGRERRRERV